MLQGWVVILAALAYIGLLFVIASYGDSVRGGALRSRMLIYPLSLAIYCTSWTFFGSVGLASRTGWDFLTIYIGPVIMVGLCFPLVMRIVRLAKSHNITSIADFIAARYGKGQAVAATVALIAILGSVPYIALQLKAVSSSLTTILGHRRDCRRHAPPLIGDISLFVAFSMAAFAVLFGTRHTDATEHQQGLMLAVATESIVKLFAFFAVGIFVTFYVFGGPVALLTQAMERPEIARVVTSEPNFSVLLTMTLLSSIAIVLLPRQFHVMVVENQSEAEIKRAAWLFPLYLVLINIFVLPIALAGPAAAAGQRRRQRHVRAGAAARGGLGVVHARRLHRRAVGRDRDGDRRIGRARHHGVERHRRCRWCSSAARRSPAATSDVGALHACACAAWRSSASCCSPISTTASRATRSSPRSACSRSRRSRSSRRPSSAA